MIRDLEPEEGMDSLQSLRVGGGNLNFRAAGRVVIAVVNLAAEFSHGGSAGRRGVMDEHWDIEVTCGKALDDM